MQLQPKNGPSLVLYVGGMKKASTGVPREADNGSLYKKKVKAQALSSGNMEDGENWDYRRAPVEPTVVPMDGPDADKESNSKNQPSRKRDQEGQGTPQDSTGEGKGGKLRVGSIDWGDSYSSEEKSWFLLFLMISMFSSVVIWLRVSMPEDLEIWITAANGAGLGGLVTMIIWLESRSAKSPTAAFTKSGGWMLLGIVTILAWSGMVWLSYSVIGHPVMFRAVEAVDGDFVITLYAILAVTSLMLWSSVHCTDVFSATRIRSPWTPAAVAAVVLQCAAFQLYSGSEVNMGMYFAEIFVILLVIIGSCVWLYARSSKSGLMNVISIIAPMILVVALNYENSGYIGRNEWLLWHLMLPLIVMFAFWLSSSVVTISSNKFRLILRHVAWISLTMVIAFFVFDLEAGDADFMLNSEQARSALFQLGLLSFIAAVLLHRDHLSYLERPKVRILKILGENDEEYRSKGDGKTMSFNFQVGLFGAMGAGKSSFIFSLWTMMRHTASRRIWWKGEESWIESGDHKQMSNDGKDYAELMNWGDIGGKNVPEKTKLKSLLDGRICKYTCEQKIKSGVLPDPSTVDFPFWADAGASDPKSEKYLKDHMYNLTTSKSIDAKSTTGTAESHQILMDITFPAKISTTSRSFFGGRPKSESACAEMDVRIESLDYPGEYFILAMDYIRFAINKDRSFVNRGLRKELDRDILNAVKAKNSTINLDDKEDMNLVATAITLLLRSHSLFYVADIDRVTDASGGGLEAEGSENFFSVMSDVTKAAGSKLVKVQCLLNKADKLLPRADDLHPNINLDVDGKNLPKSWGELLDDDKARAVLNDISNNRLDRLEDRGRGPKVGVKFTCTYGGLIEEDKKVRAPNPFIPVNSMESFLDLILDSEMTPEDR